MEEIEIQIPTKVQIRLNGRAKQSDNKLHIRWFDNTEKIVDNYDIVYMGYNITELLQQINALYQLNPRMISEVKINTI